MDIDGVLCRSLYRVPLSKILSTSLRHLLNILSPPHQWSRGLRTSFTIRPHPPQLPVTQNDALFPLKHHLVEVAQKHRRSHETERSPPILDQSSSPAPPSPSQRKSERFASAGGALFKGIARPTAFVQALFLEANVPGDPRFPLLVSREGMAESAHCAYPVMEDEKENDRAAPSSEARIIPAAPSSEDAGGSESDDYLLPAARVFANKQGLRIVRRQDGTDDFRPLTGDSALPQTDLVTPRAKPNISITNI